MKKEELLKQGFVAVCDGLFMINKDAIVYREKDGEWTPAPIMRSKGYLSTSCYTGKEASGFGFSNKIMYLHKGLAEAFIPNPNNYPIVYFRNKLKDDIRLENLYWGDTDDALHLQSRKDDVYCSVCHSEKEYRNKYRKKVFICSKCKAQLKRKEAAAEQLKGVELDKLDDLGKEICQKLLDGMPIIEIAKETGYTRQWVYYLIRRLVENQNNIKPS